jgi:Domain of unknown function (DUF4342)
METTTPTTTTPTTTSPSTDPIAEPTPVDAATPGDEDLGLWEKIELTADELEDSLESLVHEGTARRITVKKDGEVIADFPLAVGVVGAVLAAPLAAVAAIVALIADCTIEVVRERAAEDTSDASTTEPAVADTGAADAGVAEMAEPAGDAAPLEMPVAAAAVTV